MVRRQSKRARNASSPLTDMEALMLELDGVTPEELDRLSEEACAASSRGYRLDAADFAARASARAGEATSGPTSFVHRAARDDVAARRPSSRARVHGDAMREAGFREGDIVELDHDMEPEDGDVVLAEVEDFGRVLRKLKIVGGAWILNAASPGIPSIVVEDPAEITFHGVVVSRRDH